MTCDESLYRQYLSGDDEGLNALMKKYGDPLTLYIDGYLHDVHEAEELILDNPGTSVTPPYGRSRSRSFPAALKNPTSPETNSAVCRA